MAASPDPPKRAGQIDPHLGCEMYRTVISSSQHARTSEGLVFFCSIILIMEVVLEHYVPLISTARSITARELIRRQQRAGEEGKDTLLLNIYQGASAGLTSRCFTLFTN